MIAYEDLCQALDRYNRRLRGEEVPAEEYASTDDFDIVATDDAGEAAVAAELGYEELEPDVTAETAVPDAQYGEGGSGDYAEQGYDSGAVPGQPAEAMPSDQYSSGQQAAPGQPAEEMGSDQYSSGQQPAPEGYPDDQDPNRQQ